MTIKSSYLVALLPTRSDARAARAHLRPQCEAPLGAVALIAIEAALARQVIRQH